jgi:hypothetical protein
MSDITKLEILEHGIAPSQAESFLFDTYQVSPMDLLNSKLDAHEVIALARIAVGDNQLYLLEDMYAVLKAETLESEKAMAVPGNIYYWDRQTVEQMAAERRNYFLQVTADIRSRYPLE